MPRWAQPSPLHHPVPGGNGHSIWSVCRYWAPIPALGLDCRWAEGWPGGAGHPQGLGQRPSQSGVYIPRGVFCGLSVASGGSLRSGFLCWCQRPGRTVPRTSSAPGLPLWSGHGPQKAQQKPRPSAQIPRTAGVDDSRALGAYAGHPTPVVTAVPPLPCGSPQPGPGDPAYPAPQCVSYVDDVLAGVLVVVPDEEVDEDPPVEPRVHHGQLLFQLPPGPWGPAPHAGDLPGPGVLAPPLVQQGIPELSPQSPRGSTGPCEQHCAPPTPRVQGAEPTLRAGARVLP